MNIKYVRTAGMLHTRGKSRIIVFVRVLLRLFHDRNTHSKRYLCSFGELFCFWNGQNSITFILHSVPDDKVNGS